MARKKLEFRPDPQRAGILNKLYLTASQRRTLAKWLLYSAVCILSLVIQGSVLGRTRFFGGQPDLVPAAIALICMVEGAIGGSTFSLCASLIYVFSGMAPGYFTIAVLTLCCSAMTLFRESYLRSSFSSLWLCAAGALMVYELATYGIGAILEYTTAARFPVFITTALLSIAVMPLYYPVLRWIGTIGGSPWKE